MYNEKAILNMHSGWLRFALVCEFLLAVIAVFTLWSQVGGQGHLDLMTWYWKLLLGGGLSLTVVLLTRSLVEGERWLTRGVVTWALLAVLLVAGMALVTMYYHAHEATEEGDEESTTAAMIPGGEGWS